MYMKTAYNIQQSKQFLLTTTAKSGITGTLKPVSFGHTKLISQTSDGRHSLKSEPVARPNFSQTNQKCHGGAVVSTFSPRQVPGLNLLIGSGLCVEYPPREVWLPPCSIVRQRPDLVAVTACSHDPNRASGGFFCHHLLNVSFFG